MTAWVSVATLLTEVEACLKGILSGTAAKGMTPPQVYVLEELYAKDAQTMTALARAIGLSTSSATVVVDDLAGLGLVKRSPSPQNRRSVIVSLTPGGEGLRGTINDALTELDEWFPQVDWTPNITPSGKEVPV